MTASEGEGPVTGAGYPQGPCPWGDACGGCELEAVPQPERVERLRTRVALALGLDAPPAWVDSPRPTAHRARIKLAIDGGRVGYRAARSHDLVEFGTCRIARPEIQAVLPRLRAWVATYGEPFDRAFSGVALRAYGDDYRTFRVIDVLERSPASAAGIKKDDVFVAIDGVPADQLRLWMINDMFERPNAYTVTILRGNRTLTVNLTPAKLI